MLTLALSPLDDLLFEAELARGAQSREVSNEYFDCLAAADGLNHLLCLCKLRAPPPHRAPQQTNLSAEQSKAEQKQCVGEH